MVGLIVLHLILGTARVAFGFTPFEEINQAFFAEGKNYSKIIIYSCG
jgi:hypothetical protein